MKITSTLICTMMTLTVLITGCTASYSTNSSSPANTAKPANLSSSPASNSTTNSTANAAAPKKTDAAKPTAKLTDEKKPEGKAKTASKIAVPDSWVYVYDEAKGYGFSVPEGSTGGSETSEGVDTFVAETPAPSEVAVVVISFKDKKMTKEDLLDVAVKFLEGMDKKVQPGKLTGESADYSLAEATTSDPDGAKQKCKILVGTDVTDNYVMIVGTEEAKFAANEKIIDEIWGSFEMWSGGSNGGN